jgi:parallel beta-helix repeat protein
MTTPFTHHQEKTMFSTPLALRSRLLKRLAPLLAILAVTGSTWALATPQTAQAAQHRTITVRPGTGTISAAVATARPGDHLVLTAGTFRDSVSIEIPIRISGSGPASTVIRPPAHPAHPCDADGVDGLCVLGAGGVTIEGLRVTGFSGSGVFGLNTDRLNVHNVRADHNSGYGIARFVSTRSTIEANTASYNGEAGIYVGDSPNARSVVRNNTADHNGFGVFLRDSTEVVASGNRFWSNCIGIFALDSGHGAPADTPAGDYTITGNRAYANDLACPAGEHPPFSGVGIGLFGVHDTRVSGNAVAVNKPTGPSLASGGIALASTRASGGHDPRHNLVRDNRLYGNRPADITSDGTGSGNTIAHNICSTTIPSRLGGCTRH